MRLPLLFSFVLLSSCLYMRMSQPVAGVYTTYKPALTEQVSIERRFRARVYPLPAVMLYLRDDGSYVFGFCDNQVSEAGRYTRHGDTILLHHRYHFDDRMDRKPAYIYRDKQHDVLYLVTPLEQQQPEHYWHKLVRGTAVNRIIPVKTNNNNKTHVGFIRGQEMPLDSIKRFYKQHSVAEQNRWTDSVLATYAHRSP